MMHWVRRWLKNEPNIVFAIPLRARATSKRWLTDCYNLQVTVRSCLAQKGAKPLVVVCGHDKPDFLEEREFRSVVFCQPDTPVPSDPSEYMKDKTRKKMTAAAVSRKEIGQGCFFMFLDGDDILLPNLFSEVRGRVTDGDIVLRSGYMVDESTKAVAKIAPPNSSFYKVCGSCFVSKVTPSDIPMTADDRTAFVANLIDHTKFIEVSTRHKRDCVYLDDPFAVYYVGHGSNDHTIRGATPYIADLLKRGAVETDEANSVLSLITAMKPKSAI